MKKLVVACCYDIGGRMYDFFTDLEDLKGGDLVVVDSAEGFGVATVRHYRNTSTKADKWVVQKVDTEAHQERMTRIRQAEDLKAKMKKRYEEMSEIAIFEKMAEVDDEMKSMLEALKGLDA